MSIVLSLKVVAVSWAGTAVDHNTAAARSAARDVRSVRFMTPSSTAFWESVAGKGDEINRPSVARMERSVIRGSALRTAARPSRITLRSIRATGYERGSALHAHRNAHAAADAQGGEAFLSVAPLHFVQQRDQHARAGRSDRMPECDRAAVDVDPAGVPAKVLVDGAGLGGESLVRLDEIEVADRPACFLEGRARRRDRPRAHDGGIDARVGPGHDAGQHLAVLLGGLARLHQHHRGGAVVDAGRIGGRDRAVLGEGGAQLTDAVERGAVLGKFVGVDDDVALARLDGDGRDLLLEPAGLLGRFRLVLPS